MEPLALAPEPTASRWWGRSRAPPRRTGSIPGCGWGRRLRAAQACGSCRPIPSVPRPPGSRCCRRSSGSAPASSRGGRGRRTSRPARCGGCTAASSRECSHVPGARSGCPPASARRPAASAPSRRPAGARPGRGAQIVPAGAARAFLAPLPVGLLRARLPARARVAPTCRRRWSGSACERSASSRRSAPPSVADRFGRPGCDARELAHGLDTPLRPRPPRESMVERLDLPEAASGFQLEQTLDAADRPPAGAARARAGGRCARCDWARASSSREPGGTR